MTDQSRLTWALIISVLLHGLLLTLMPLVHKTRLEIPNPASLIDVDVVKLPQAKPAPAPPAPPAHPAAPAPQLPAIPVPKQQIVSPSDKGEEKAPANARFLSDKDNTVKEETVHKGEPAAGNPETQHEAPPQKADAKAQEAKAQSAKAPSAKEQRAAARQSVEPARPHAQEAAWPKLDQLLPSAGDLIREGIVRPQDAPPPAPAPEQHAATERREDLLRHGDPWRSGGLGGSLDFLPAVREGDITMLNTKAEQFAPFVRRVAVRVFENFRILLRRSFDGARGDSVQEFATIEAVMDKQGRLVAINAKDRSLNAALATDRNLQAACREGFFDRNPPAGAESDDGKIHFIFDARVALMIEPGRGVAGYRALFQAGLM